MTFDLPLPPLTGIKIPETCVARVREELMLMNEEVKKRRKEKELQERMRQMEQENKRLPDNQNSMLNTFLSQNPSHAFALKQNALQRTQNGSMSQLEAQIQSALQQRPYGLPLMSLQSNQTHQGTHNGWSNSSTSSSTNSQVALPKPMSHSFPQFYNQPFLSSYHLSKNTSLHQTAPSPDLSSTNPLNEILDLTMSSPSPSTDSTDAGPSLDFNLALFAPDAPPPAATQQPLMLQHNQAPQPPPPPQNHNLLTNNHDQDILEILGLAPSPTMPPQKPNPSSSASTSSTSSLSNNMVSLFSIPSSSPSSSSSSSSLFSNSLATPYLLQQPDPVSLPNGHISSGALDVREALHSMLQAGQDRKSVIQYPQQD